MNNNNNNKEKLSKFASEAWNEANVGIQLAVRQVDHDSKYFAFSQENREARDIRIPKEIIQREMAHEIAENMLKNNHIYFEEHEFDRSRREQKHPALHSPGDKVTETRVFVFSQENLIKLLNMVEQKALAYNFNVGDRNP